MLRRTLNILLLVTASAIYSQELLDKDEAIKITLENNLGIKIAQNNLSVAENNANILNSGYLPTVTGNAGGSIDRQTTEGQLANGDVRTAEGAETRRYNASINLNYVLFDGMSRYYDYKRFKEQYDQTELQVRQTIETTILQLFTVYYEVARLEENVNTLREALNVSKDRYKRAKYQFEFGQNTGLDVLNSEVDINTDSINLLNAQQLLRNTQRDLNLIMNRDLSTGYQVDTMVTFVPNIKMEDIVLKAKENNVDMLIIEKDMSIIDYTLKSAKGVFLPTIGLTGSYGWNESNNNSPLAFVLQNTNSGVSGGINLTWSLFDGGTTITNVKNAKINYESQELLKTQLEQEIDRDIQNAWDAYQNAMYILSVQEKNLETNENNFSRTDERFKLGQTTSIEFRQAQINLLNAQLARSQAKYNAKLSELQILQVSGQLLNVDF